MISEVDLQHQFYDMLLESQYWPEADIIAYQRSQLEQLVRHARKNVPFYETRLDAIFARDGSMDWAKWEQIPIATRADLHQHREAMQARELPPGHGATGTATSSGSTGTPVTVTINKLVMMTVQANRWRSHAWRGIDWSETLCMRTYGVPPLSETPNGTNRGIWGPPWDPLARRGTLIDVGGNSSPREFVQYLVRMRPQYITSGAKTIHVFTVEAERLGLNIALRGALAHGERVTEADKAACRRVFGAPLVDLYGSKEGGQMAHPCEYDAGMHVNSESILVEIVDAEGKAVPPGVPGRVVITPFFSTAQPMIRYDQGDMAVMGGVCKCGRTLPVIKEVLGRSSAIFRHPDGRTAARFLAEEARNLLDCGMWQIAQIGPLDFEIRYMPNNWNQYGNEQAVVEIFRECFFDDARVSFKRLHDLRATAAGKYQEYVYEA